jgi:hypothetical protein
MLLLLLIVLLAGLALRLRLLRYSSAGLRKMPVLFWTMSVAVPIREEVRPVTGSQR